MDSVFVNIYVVVFLDSCFLESADPVLSQLPGGAHVAVSCFTASSITSWFPSL